MNKLFVILLLIFPILIQADQGKVTVNGFEIPPLWYQAYYDRYLHISGEYQDRFRVNKNCTPIRDELKRESVIRLVLIAQTAKKQGIVLDASDKEGVDELTKEINDLPVDASPTSRAGLEITRLDQQRIAFTRALLPEITADDIQAEYISGVRPYISHDEREKMRKNWVSIR